jgi:hypothetical protein
MVNFGCDEGKTTVADSTARNFIASRRQMKPGRQVDAGLCPFTLCIEPKKYMVPSSLVRTIQYLFQNYATLLANPFVFDTVLDLYDCFSTLYDILTRHLPELYGQENYEGKGGTNSLQQIPAEVVPQLSRYVSALHRAMEHRLYRAFPEEAHRDMDVDFRGGLNQLISGADALVKAAMGFVKRFALPPGAFAESELKQRFNLFGVVNRIDFEPEIVATSLWLGTEHKARLAIIRSDVPHLCVVASYLDFIHEVGHIVFAEHRHPREPEAASGALPRAPLLPLVPVRSDTEELLSEIYTHSLTTLLVCRDEPQVFAKHSMVSFALASRHGVDLPSRYVSFLRFSFEVFVAKLCIEELQKTAAAYPDGWGAFIDESITSEIVEMLGLTPGDLCERFRDFVEGYGPVCHDYPLYQKHDGDHSYIDSLFVHHWDSIRYSLPLLMANVVTVYLRFVARLGCKSEEDTDAAGFIAKFQSQMQSLEKGVLEALIQKESKGIPVINVIEKVASDLGFEGVIESFYVIVLSLSAAMRLRMKSLDLDNKKFLVPLDVATGEIDFKNHPSRAGEDDYSDYLIRPKDSFLFCCKPPKRRERLQRQIALLKTLWNTASQIKARRFKSLIQNSISQPIV